MYVCSCDGIKCTHTALFTCVFTSCATGYEGCTRAQLRAIKVITHHGQEIILLAKDEDLLVFNCQSERCYPSTHLGSSNEIYAIYSIRIHDSEMSKRQNCKYPFIVEQMSMGLGLDL